MSLVVITGDGPQHRFVANTIMAAHEVDAVLVCNDSPSRSWRRTLKLSRRLFVDKSLRRLYLAVIGDRVQRAKSLARVFGAGGARFCKESLIDRVGQPKDGRLFEVVAALRPHIIAVYGTSIIPNDVLGEAREIALNMHTGLSPWYRGTACSFWPLVKSEPNMVGATVHKCTSTVDGGDIYFREAATLYRDDDLHAVFARAAIVGARGYAQVIADAMKGRLHGEPQDLTIGKEFRSSMLTIGAELTARRNLRRLSRDWPIEQSAIETPEHGRVGGQRVG